MGTKFLGGKGLVKASNARNGLIMFDLPSKRVRQPLKNSSVAISQNDYNGMRITPDGLLAIVGSTGSPYLRVLDPVADAWVTPIATLPGSAVNSIAFTAAGDRFAVAFQSSPFLYEYSYPGFVIQPTPAVPPASAVAGVSYNGAGTKLALALFATPWLEVYDVATATKESIAWASPITSGLGSDVSFNTAGNKIAVTGSSVGARNVRVWEYPSGTLLFSDTSTTVSQKCEFCPDDSKLAVLRPTGSSGIRIYNTTTWTFTDINTTLSDFYSIGTRNLKWVDNRFIFMSSEGGSCIIFDTTTGLPVSALEHGFHTSVGIGVISPLTVIRKLAGNVTDAGLSPVARKIRAYDSLTGEFTGETISDAGTGNFEMMVFSSATMTVFAIGSGGENAQIYDPVTPAVWP